MFAVTQIDVYSQCTVQESASDLAMPVNLIKGSSLVINGSDYTHAVNCYLIALPHSATHSVAASLECGHTGRLGVWACDCECRGCVHAG